MQGEGKLRLNNKNRKSITDIEEILYCLTHICKDSTLLSLDNIEDLQNNDSTNFNNSLNKYIESNENLKIISTSREEID